MDELVPRPATAGLDLPFMCGGATLDAEAEAPLASLAPFRGRAAALGEALGAPLPGPGAALALGDGSQVVWSGLDQWLLRGPAAEPANAARLADLAAVADQSDGWTALRLTGNAGADALARLAPVDLDRTVFPAGSVARTELRHMMCVLIAREEGFTILVMRSFAETAVHEIAAAMRAVAARAQIASVRASGERVNARLPKPFNRVNPAAKRAQDQ